MSTQSTGVHATEQLLFYTLLQLCIIVLAARAGGLLAKRFGQAAVVGEIIVGNLARAIALWGGGTRHLCGSVPVFITAADDDHVAGGFAVFDVPNRFGI